MNRIFNQLLNVKNTVVEDACIVDSPLRPEPVLEVRVRPRRGMLRCSRCGRKCSGYDRGGGARRWRHQDFGCWRVELVAAMPRVDCPKCGVVVARVPWAEPGSRFTRDFEAECAWPVASRTRRRSAVPRISHGGPRETSPAGSPNGSERRCPRRSTASPRSAWLQCTRQSDEGRMT